MALSELFVALPLVSSGVPISQIIAIYLAFGFVSWYFITSLTAWYRLKDFPGPPTTGFSNIWSAKAVWTGQTHKIFPQAQEKYGPLTRIGPNSLLVADAAAAANMNTVRGSYTRSADWYLAARLDPWDTTIVSETDSAVHSERKTKLYGGFNGKGEMDMEKDINVVISNALELVRTKYMHTATSGPKPYLDFTHLSRYMAVDSITLVGFGQAWNNVGEEKDHYSWLHTLDRSIRLLLTLSYLPHVSRILFWKPIMSLIAPKPTDKGGMGLILGVIKKEVARRFKDGQAHGTPVRSVVGHTNMLDEWVKTGMTQRSIELEVTTQLSAGTDTTSSAMQGTMLWLLSTPSAYARLKAEIALAIREGRISSPITHEEARKLPYLQAVLNEGLRMMPPVMCGFPRSVPPEGDMVCGRFVPGGTDLHINYIGMLQDKRIFGHDAHLFRPERYLEGDEEHRNMMFKTTDLAFSTGRWKCLGQKMAWMQLEKVFVEFLRNFDLQIPNPHTPCTLRAYCLPEMDDFMIRVTEAKME
ncbi:cytochrome P450 [Sordaria brevicollis]|uniref:Cytochrome P450 monooxygenase ABA1 n=1 Tax=Sordaria brevicollis TaxID=83679 RepID=A0AAE0UE74_SORBR|nr:cytochrome P450 [Sordaria brevicollis]